MKPPRLQTMAWSTLKTSPHTQIDGLSAISQSYLSFRASRNSPLFRLKPISPISMTVSELDAPFSEASSTARCVLGVREFLMSFSLVQNISFFSLRTLCWSELTMASSGVSWACETIFLTSGAVVFIDAWYCRSASWLGFIIPSPPSLTGSAKRSLSLGVVQWWSVIDGIKTSAMARSRGSSRSSISGSVLRKYVHRCRKPNVKAA